MKVSILCIGNELLSGKTLNTNASWISRKLSDIGCDIVEHLVVPDKKEKGKQAKQLLKDSSLNTGFKQLASCKSGHSLSRYCNLFSCLWV